MMIKLDSAAVTPRLGAILVSTQYYENYAIDDAGYVDGENPYWKPKFGSDILVTGVDAEATDLEIEMILDRIKDRTTWENDASYSYVAGWSRVPADFAFGDWRDEMIERIPA